MVKASPVNPQNDRCKLKLIGNQVVGAFIFIRRVGGVVLWNSIQLGSRCISYAPMNATPRHTTRQSGPWSTNRNWGKHLLNFLTFISQLINRKFIHKRYTQMQPYYPIKKIVDICSSFYPHIKHRNLLIINGVPIFYIGSMKLLPDDICSIRKMKLRDVGGLGYKWRVWATSFNSKKLKNEIDSPLDHDKSFMHICTTD